MDVENRHQRAATVVIHRLRRSVYWTARPEFLYRDIEFIICSVYTHNRHRATGSDSSPVDQHESGAAGQPATRTTVRRCATDDHSTAAPHDRAPGVVTRRHIVISTKAANPHQHQSDPVYYRADPVRGDQPSTLKKASRLPRIAGWTSRAIGQTSTRTGRDSLSGRSMWNR